MVVGHCECTDHSLGWGNCREMGWENSECTWDVPGEFVPGTLSISLQCTCDVPAQYTTPCPQCLRLLVLPLTLLPMIHTLGRTLVVRWVVGIILRTHVTVGIGVKSDPENGVFMFGFEQIFFMFSLLAYRSKILGNTDWEILGGG